MPNAQCRSRSVRRACVVALCILNFAFCILLSGCGYTHSGDDPSGSYQWRSLYREDVKSVAVPIFTNKTFRRGVEFALTRAVVTQIEAKSPYKVVPRERADTILEGQIVEIRLQNLSSDSTIAIPQEQLYLLTVDFIWKDLRTGRILTERKNFQQTTTFYPTLGEGEFVGSQQGVEKLALGIVQELQANW
ncbi:hypothetical protein BH09PLA1_BH09PLA1_18820 [soil metagenome]